MDAIDAFIFAAGLGTRMGALSEALPKPAWTIKGKPLLQWSADSFKRAGCKRIACNAHHHIDVIKSIAEDIEVFEEKTLLGTGEPLKRIARRISPEGLLVWNADNIAEVPWEHLRSESIAKSAGVGWLLVPHPGGDWTKLYMDSEDRVLPRWETGPKGPYLFTGAAYWSAAAANDIPENCFDVRDFVAAYPKHYGIVVEPFPWLEIGTPAQLIRVAAELAPDNEGRVPGCYIHPTAAESKKIKHCVMGPGAAPNIEDNNAFWFFNGENQVRIELELN